MALFKKCIPRRSKSRGPSPYDDDIIYPVHKLDDTNTYRNLRLAWTLCFNDVLDAEKLRSSLARLLEIGDWKKIGGRLKQKKDGKLEIHAPRMFTPDRPAFAYSHEHFDMNMEEHESTKDFPVSNGEVSIWPSPHSFVHLAARPDEPKTPKDLMSGDTPQISLRITSFNNATLVAILWPHTLMDILGQTAFLHAWSLVLNGRESEVPPVLGVHDDPLLEAIGTSSERSEEYMLKDKQIKGSSLIKFVSRFAWDMLRGPPPETQTVCIPEKTMAAMRLKAQSDIVASVNKENQSFVSDGDILTAWALRAVSTSLPQPRPVTAMHAMNARFRIPAIDKASGVFVQNMLLYGYSPLSAEEAMGSLGTIALKNRQHIADQATKQQVLASLREQFRSKDASKLLYCDADALLMPFTNWSKANLLRTADFSAAVIRAGDTRQTRQNPPGSPTFQHTSTMKQNRTTKLVVAIMGKDYEGNYWLTMTLSPAAWKKARESLARFSSSNVSADMTYITETQAKEAINVKSSLPVFRRAYLQCNEGGVSTGPRLVMPLDDSGNKGQWLTANYPVEGFFGTKFSAGFPGNLQKGLPATISTISLYSSETGELKATIEANALTAIKTAGSAAIATDLLSRKDSSTLAIIGSGLQAFDQVLAIREVREIRHVIVYDLDPARATKFVGFLQAVDGYDVETTVARSADEAVAKADIVCTCTTSRKPVFKGTNLKPGTHINAIGSYAPDMQEIDSDTVVRADCIITEHVDGLWAAAGDVLHPFEQGLIEKSKISGSVGDVLAGSIPGRKNENEITLYESVGSAVLDLAIAVETYKQVAKEQQATSRI
ncbi:hypothetical protein OPT61_g5360 [Boeremia exigua]|uniref:Uncharacterized protein n=1 Tax=Boeremia exigua TaxID=749465 RepID=A0ACC2IAP0_9PLEO|nr:hypothetical protein OPT61_g5360 [Boeremia exigua]